MLHSIFSGVSALQSFQTGIDVLANNISNVNTVGFKGSSVEFANLFEAEVSTSANSTTRMQSGLGVRVNATALDLTGGSNYQTENQTDLAIVGDDGWFGLTGLNNEESFTRAGNFYFDPYASGTAQADLRLVNPEGLLVTGTLANNTAGGTLSPVVDSLDLTAVDLQQPLIFPSELTFPLVPTTQADFFGNIGLDNVSRSIGASVIGPATAESPNGEQNQLRLVFTQSAVQPATGSSWDISATITTRDYDLASGAGTLYDTQTGSITFDDQGSVLTPSTLGSLSNNGSPVIANLGTGFSGIVSNGGPISTSSVTADGTLTGELIGYSVNQNGDVISSFTNGKQSTVGKVAIYHFQNDQGLEALSGNQFRTSSNSGEPIFYEENNGQLRSSMLENSNVTLDRALTELIIMQRSYDAAAKTISTSDQMLKNALQM